MLQRLRELLAALSDRTFHFVAAPNTAVPFLVWGEDGATALLAEDRHAETGMTGTVDLFTKAEAEPLFDGVQDALERSGAAWYLNSVQFEDDTGLIHYEWVWSVV